MLIFPSNSFNCLLSYFFVLSKSFRFGTELKWNLLRIKLSVYFRILVMMCVLALELELVFNSPNCRDGHERLNFCVGFPFTSFFFVPLYFFIVPLNCLLFNFRMVLIQFLHFCSKFIVCHFSYGVWCLAIGWIVHSQRIVTIFHFFMWQFSEFSFSLDLLNYI